MEKHGKRLLSVVLCLCMLAGMAPVRTEALGGVEDPPTITFGDFSDGRYTYSIDRKIITMNYTPGADSDNDTFSIAVDQKQNKLTIATESNKLSELCYVPVNATLSVPAYTTYNVDLTFTINATQTVSNKKATAGACFELLAYGTEPSAWRFMHFKPATEDTKSNDDFYAFNTNGGISLAKGYHAGKSDGKTRQLGSGTCTVTVTCAFRNTTGSAQNVTHYFGIWAETQYGSTYSNKLDLDLTVSSTNPISPLDIAFADLGPYEYGQTTTPGLKGDRDPGYRGYLYDYTWYSCDKDGGNQELLKNITTKYDTAYLDDLYNTPNDLPVGEHYYYLMVTSRKETGGLTTVQEKVVKVTISKATPSVYDFPKIPTLDLSKGKTLGDCVLSGGSGINRDSNATVPGTFKWDNPNTVPTKTGTQRFSATFYPDDTLNYNTAAVSMTVNVICSQHKYNAGEVTKAATCTGTGKLKKACVYCGATTSTTLPALGHDYTGGTWVYDDAQHWKKCSRCTEENTANKTNHTFGSWSGGKRSCTACGYEETSVVSVAITWGEMAFTYTDGTWDPTLHEYTGGGWTVNSTDGNRITIANEGTEAVTIALSYTKVNSTVAGIFKDSGGAAITSPCPLGIGVKKEIWLQLSGAPDKDLSNTTIGTITVRLGGN